MICPNCNENNPDGSTFCIKCGNNFNLSMSNSNLNDNSISNQQFIQQPISNDAGKFKIKNVIKILILLMVIVIVVLIVFSIVNKNINNSKKINNNAFTLITVGHIGHGKTELTSAISKMYGKYVTKEQLENSSKITKNLTTMDVSKIEFNSNKRDYLLYDIPTFEDINKSLLSGAIVPDGVILVVSALDGIMPQTRANIELLSHIGIENVIVFINNCDMIDDMYYLELIQNEIKELLIEYGLDGNNISLILGSATKVIEGDKKYEDSINKLINEINKWSFKSSKKEVEKSELKTEVCLLSKKEAGKYVTFVKNEKYNLELEINNKNIKADMEFLENYDILMQDDCEYKLKFILQEPINVREGDFFQLKVDKIVVGFGVIYN